LERKIGVGLVVGLACTALTVPAVCGAEAEQVEREERQPPKGRGREGRE
jgi:hypothetical protein